MKQLINENNITMTTNLNESMNENLKEFQSTFMKTVDDMIAKKMIVINLNMIQTIKGTLTRQTLQYTTQENHQSPNNIRQYALTQPPTLANTTTDADTNIEDQPPSESTTTTSSVNAMRKQDDQLCPEETQDTIPEVSNDTVMEDQNSITLQDQRNQTRF